VTVRATSAGLTGDSHVGVVVTIRVPRMRMLEPRGL